MVFKEKNPLYEALLWIILQQAKELDNSSFIVQPASNKKYETYEMADFNILPKKKQQIKNWNRVQFLSDLNDLETVVLDEPQEILLKKELNSFVNKKSFKKN
ncbi:17723_t:CDS:2, partial [Gigaspora margarita]